MWCLPRPRAAAQLPGKVTDPARGCPAWLPSRLSGSAPHPPGQCPARAQRPHPQGTAQGGARGPESERSSRPDGPQPHSLPARRPRERPAPGPFDPASAPTHRLAGPRSRRGRAVRAHGAHAARGLCTHVTAVAPPPAWPRPARPGTAGRTAGRCAARGLVLSAATPPRSPGPAPGGPLRGFPAFPSAPGRRSLFVRRSPARPLEADSRERGRGSTFGPSP